MSQGIHKRPQETHRTSKAKQHTGKIIAQLDERIHHLQEHIVPRQPYLVSVPSDVPYRHSTRFTNTWYEGTPFDRHEEQLQYLSFLAHQGDHESLLKVEGGWADEQGNPIEEELSPQTVPASGRNTPAEPGHRKKISLKDYKTKSKSPPTTHLRPHSLALENKVKDVGINPVVRTQETAKTPQLNTDKEEPPPKVDVRVSDFKSEAPLSNGPISGANPRKDQAEEGPSPAKKQKLLPPSEDSRSVAKPPKVESQQPSMKLPTLLSPTLPSPEDENRLPQLLSPVLPPSLAKAMSSSPNPTSLGSPVIGLHQRTESVRSILAGADLDNDPSNDRSKLAPAGSRVRSDSAHSARSSAPGTPNAVRTVLGSKVLSKNGSKVGTPLQNGARASPGPRQRHTIILKYGKKNRKRVEALLKFAPRPKKEVVKQEASNTPEIRPKKELIKQEDRDGQRTPDVKVKLSALDDVKLEKKRKAEDSPGLAVKKMKSSNLTAEDVKRPSTPVPPASRTPLMSQSRPTFTTPKKELKSTAMRRVESSDGIDVPTPTGDKGRVSTPVSAPKPSPQATSLSSREEERQQWSTMNTKFFTLGRSLKHEGTSMLPASDDDSKPAQSAKAVILIIEALLCFMINIAAQGHARPSVDPGWRSIILYHIFVWRASRKYPHLHGLVVQLGAVCRQYVQKYDLEKLARDPLPEDYCNSAPTPSSDGNTRPSEDVEKYKKRYIQFRDDMIHNIHELQTAWLDGFRQLSPELLRREYPNTWGKRAKDASARMQEKPSPSKIARDFYLPMDANTTPFEAARFGFAFLEEWAEKEKIEWKTKMDF
ncbi:hypothetical protein LTR20_011015 [Exophiala xenobiotica]|uniref:Uncharacterized protein n=1 Tax=Vermiconidia calcicola TaxID=1690605 RepID=A0AAV9PR03_9PEZI|nr:hypothetical protein LTS13_010957 [Exophiala xenobiotica]KAK5528031.1 hypothetical protein LTR25_010697 [Vermiconidia calcicola]KAK5391587.1 hypothetical protein LTR79_011038 [Exophiala xenobiotica]KAK5433672.1 hypothetical protein LTR18_010622 [Exophiala xenobiotica]KAK5452583.1 hypothetical protein LTR20_011015 [Exophiala xenobiotica]